MAHETIQVEDEKVEPMRVRVKESLRTITKHVLPPFLDSLILLTIAGWYFFFTGLAICLGKELPKGWLSIATHLTKGKIAQRIAQMGKTKEDIRPVHHRVVDLDSQQNIL